MNEYILIYLIERLDTLESMFIVFALVCAILCAILTIVYFTENNDLFKDYKHTKKPFLLFPIFIFLACLTPSTNQAYKIIGIGTVVKYVNNSEEVNKLPDNLVQYVNIQLEKVMKEEQEDEANNTR